MIGRTLSHYRIIDKLGEGGMGAVYLAEDLELEREVALKVLPDDVAGDAKRLDRFRREAKTVARLNHPGIVTVHSVEEAEGVHFITMEYVRGVPLSSRVSPGGMAIAGFLDVATSVADALRAAHEKGIVHRDLKPANVMISSEGLVKVLDFGLAKPQVSEEAGEDTPTEWRTERGLIVGTAPYMSPEQATGQDVGTPSDIFSLGILLYELATGERPFHGQSKAEVLSSILRDTPVPLTTRRPDLPPRLGVIVQRCLEKNPDERWPSAAVLRDELEAVRVEILTSGRGRSDALTAHAPDRNELRPRVRTWVFSALAVSILAVLAIVLSREGVTKTVPSPPAEAVRDASLAILPFEVSGGDQADADFASGIHEDLITQVSRIGSLKVISRTSVMKFQGSDVGIPRVAKELGVATVMEGSVRRSGNRVRVSVALIDAASEHNLWRDSFDRELTAKNVFDIQSEIAQDVASALQTSMSSRTLEAIKTSPTDNLDAYHAYLSARALDRLSPISANLFRKVELLEDAVRLDPSFALAWAALSTAHAQLYWRGFDRTSRRLQQSERALERAESLAPDLPEAKVARGYYRYWGYRDYAQALIAFAEAEKDLPNDASLIAVQAFIQRRVGLWDESLARMARAIELDPLNTYLITNQASSYWVLRDAEKAQALYRRASDIDPSTGRRDAGLLLALLGDTSIGDAHGFDDDLASLDALVLERRFDDAIAYTEGVELEVWSGQVDWTTATLERGLVLELAGRHAEARRELRQAVDQARAALKETPEDPRILDALARALAGLGDAKGATDAALRAVELVPYERDAMDAGRYVYILATVYAMLGEDENAITTLETYMANPGFCGIGYIAKQPLFDRLRGNPRYEALLARYSA